MKRGRQAKKGQVTLFIIIAIVVVALGITTWLLWPRISGIFMTETEAQTYLATQGAQLRDAVSYCVSTVSEDIIKEQGLHAGYYSYSNLYALDFAGPKLVVMYKDANKVRVNKFPSLSEVTNEYSRALDLEGYARIDSCLNDFADFKRKMTVEPGDRVITSEIYEESVVIKTDWPITIRKGRASSTLSQKDTELLIPLGRVWTVANDILNSEAQQKPFQDLVLVQYVTSNYQLLKYIDLDGPHHYPEADTVVWMLKTKPYRTGETEYLFYFALDRR